MSRETWLLIKQSKGFYVRSYRAVSSTLFLSLAINVALIAGIGYVYFTESDPDYYATNGVTPPVMLTAMGAANDTSVPMLPSEQMSDDNNKVIPQ